MHDGRLHQMSDLDDRGQDIGYPDMVRHFSRAQSYDQVGRLVSASGSLSTFSSFPYNQGYGYDEFGNSTSRSGSYYYQSYSSDGGAFQNNRRQDLSYDADGNVTHSPSYNYVGGSVVSNRDWTYDAAGRMSQARETVTANSSVSTYISNHDGDGQPVIEYYQENPASKSYMVRSSVLGGEVLTRLDNAGNKWKSTFSVDGLLRVVQYGVSYYTQYATLQWTHIDPLGLSEAGDTKAVYDPTGNYIQWQHAPTAPPNAYPPLASSSGGLGAGFGSAQDKSCVLNGEPISCSDLEHQTDTGNVAVDYLIMDSQGLRRVQGDVTSNGLGLLVVDYPRDNQDGGYELLHKIVTLPQEPAVGPSMQHWLDVYSGCVKDYFGKSSGIPIPPHDAASIILTVSSLEGTAESLLAVTWAAESPNEGFGQYFNSNPNDGSEGNADVGPFQLNYRTYGNDSRLSGLGDVFGGTTTGREMFTGDPTANGRMAARILNGYGGGKLAAIRFTTGTGPASRSAQGRARAKDRGGKYDRWHRKYDDFFKCLKDRR
jgi:hypothetical protein